MLTKVELATIQNKNPFIYNVLDKEEFRNTFLTKFKKGGVYKCRCIEQSTNALI